MLFLSDDGVGCQAHQQGTLLAEEDNPATMLLCRAEEARRRNRRRERTHRADRKHAALTSNPPSHDELQRALFCLDESVSLPSAWHTQVAALEALETPHLYAAGFFIASNPWKPHNCLFTWSAVMLGAWVITPAVFLNAPGPCVKYRSALLTKRQLWASNDLRVQYPALWLLLLELISRSSVWPPSKRWTVLATPAEYAAAKVKTQGAEVIALLTAAELERNVGVSHTFSPESLLEFLRRTDADRTSLGSCGM